MSNVVSKSLQEVIKVKQTVENSMLLVIGYCSHSSAIKDVDHEELWILLVSSRSGRDHDAVTRIVSWILWSDVPRFGSFRFSGLCRVDFAGCPHCGAHTAQTKIRAESSSNGSEIAECQVHSAKIRAELSSNGSDCGVPGSLRTKLPR